MLGGRRLSSEAYAGCGCAPEFAESCNEMLFNLHTNASNTILSLLAQQQKTEEIVQQDDGSVKWKNDCYKNREDYFECLHAKKEWAMVRKVHEEEQRQNALAAGR